MKGRIIGFHHEDQGDWVADLECGHAQDVRHRPPWQNRQWVVSEAGRVATLVSSWIAETATRWGKMS